MNNRPNTIMELCKESQTLLNHETLIYHSDKHEQHAEEIATKIEALRSTLNIDVLRTLKSFTANDENLLTATFLEKPMKPEIGKKEKYWRSFTWINIHYAEDQTGNPIKYDLLGTTNTGVHVFRIWITASGIGMGLLLAVNKKQQSRNHLAKQIPVDYIDLSPVYAKHESTLDLNLKGVRSRTNRYFAKWHPSGFKTEQDFFTALKSSWIELAPLLNQHRN